MLIKRIAIRRGKVNALFFSDYTAEFGELTDDGGLLLDRSLCESEGLTAGQNITEDRLLELVQISACRRARSRAVWLLESRDYTQKGMYDKLRRLFGDAAAKDAAHYCAQIGLIDDARFAQRLAFSMSERGISDREAVRRLVAKGVARDVAQDAVNEAESDPASQLKQIIEKKYAAKLLTGDRKEVEKVVAALARKGFGFGDIRSAISDFTDATDIIED